jgi:hypothetical protein
MDRIQMIRLPAEDESIVSTLNRPSTARLLAPDALPAAFRLALRHLRIREISSRRSTQRDSEQCEPSCSSLSGVRWTRLQEPITRKR